MSYVIVKFNRETRVQERTKFESTLIHSLWRIVSTWNREQDTFAYTIEARG